MKKTIITLGITFSLLLVSCNSTMESDANEMARMICESRNDLNKAAELMPKIEEIANKYKDDKEKFGKLVLQKSKDCLSDINSPSSSSFNEENVNEQIYMENEDTFFPDEQTDFDNSSFSE